MFKTLAFMQNNDFWRVSADTKTCGSPPYPAPTGGLCLPTDKHAGILTEIQNESRPLRSGQILRVVRQPLGSRLRGNKFEG